MLKKDSKAWQLAVRQSKRKGCFIVPVALLANGDIVLQSTIRGNQWTVTESDLLLKEEQRTLTIKFLKR